MDITAQNATQLIQLAAIGPCLFIIIYLLATARDRMLVVLPLLFFLSLLCSFLFPILSIFPEINNNANRMLLQFNEQLAPQLSFLLILQFVLRKVPHWTYWLILLLPIVGGSYFLYISVFEDEVCYRNIEHCLSTSALLILYRIFGGALTFLLLVTSLKYLPKIQKNDRLRKQKYWVIILLISYGVALLALDLFYLSDGLNDVDYAFIKAVSGILLLYLMMSSVLRVFGVTLKIRSISQHAEERDAVLAEKIRRLIDEKIFTHIDCNRGMVADTLGLTEQHLSRVVNHHFGKSFSDLMNHYRVEEAKQKLRETTEPITAISFDSGFSSITSFNRVFKNLTGVSPTQFRKQ